MRTTELFFLWTKVPLFSFNIHCLHIKSHPSNRVGRPQTQAGTWLMQFQWNFIADEMTDWSFNIGRQGSLQINESNISHELTVTNRCPGVSLLVTKKGINDSEFSQDHPAKRVQERWLLPGGAVQRGGRAAGEVLLDALIVPDLSGNRDRGGLSSRRDHGGLSWGGLRLPGGEERGDDGG